MQNIIINTKLKIKDMIINSKNLPEPPIYDGKENVVLYTRKMNEYLDLVKKNKYDIIMFFINL